MDNPNFLLEGSMGKKKDGMGEREVFYPIISLSLVWWCLFLLIDAQSAPPPSLVSDGLINDPDFRHRQPSKRVVATAIISVAGLRVSRSPEMDKNGMWWVLGSNKHT